MSHCSLYNIFGKNIPSMSHLLNAN